ncbi:EAL domain-containing protein [Neptunomonas sp.]
MATGINGSKDEEITLVGIGASAGGLEALTRFIRGLPHGLKMGFLIAQHLSPAHKTMLVELLTRETELTVTDAVHGLAIQADTIYVTPPNRNIEINANFEIILTDRDLTTFGPKPSINHLFSSIAEFKKEHAIGIILSGTGTDGAQGIRAINAAGGITMVQDPLDAKYDGMPKAAIDSCNVDMVLKPNEIGKELLALQNMPRDKVLLRHSANNQPSELDRIFELLYQHRRVDFASYKRNTINRRIERRILATKSASLTEYLALLENNAEEVSALYKDILIGVTRFFRDTESFTGLKRAFANYLDRNPDLKEVRIWIPGCSTGEETYSILILLKELLEDREQWINIQIFATDIDDDALSKARRGVYSSISLEGVHKTIVNKYFKFSDGQFEARKVLRESIVFSFHNLLSDPPFRNSDLVICRNLLIYFTNEAQEYVFPVLHYALKPGGLLFLGNSENIPAGVELFSTIDKSSKIFKKVTTAKSAYELTKLKPTRNSPSKPKLEHANKKNALSSLQDIIISEAAKLLIPHVVVTNENMDVIFKKGDIDFLTLPEGYVSYNLYKMTSPSIAVEVRKTVHQALKTEQVSSSRYFSFTGSANEPRFIKAHVVPYLQHSQPMFVIYFQQVNLSEFPYVDLEKLDSTATPDNLLQLELTHTREHLQTLVEELETSNEELQSLNEELQSSNEELQSTNEEMETSNEELQATNEELQAAYAELKEMFDNKAKMEQQLNHLNRRYESLLDNVNDAIVLTDIDGNILKTNASMVAIAQLPQSTLLKKNWHDIICKLPPGKNENHLDQLLANKKYGPYQAVIHVNNNEKKILKITDYLSTGQESDMKIWSFAQDVTESCKVLAELKLSNQKYQTTFEQANIGIAHVGLQGEWLSVNSKLCEMLGYSLDEFMTLTFQEITHTEDLEADLELLNQLLAGDITHYSMEKRYFKKDGHIIWIHLSVALVRDDENKPLFFISVIQNIDQSKRYISELEQAKVVLDSTQEAILITDLDLNIIKLNSAFEIMTGYKKDDVIGKGISLLFSKDINERLLEEISNKLPSRGQWSGEVVSKHQCDELFPVYMNINAVKNSRDEVMRYVVTMTDISALKNSQEEITYLANHDVLTSLPNRSLLTDRLNHAIANSKRNGQILAILFIDLDRFKIINDSSGHQIGDNVLKVIAKRLTNALRKQDTIARIGGDEFVALLEGIDSPLSAGKIAQGLIQQLSQPVEVGSQSFKLGGSVGISIYPNDGMTSDDLLRQADIAMYDAKEKGGSRFCFSSQDISSSALERATLENSIRKALKDNEFEVFYQPIIDLQTGEVDSLEALIRWNQPEMGQIMPSKFIPIAEQSDLIISISEYVIHTVIKDLLEIGDRYKGTVSINLSAKDFENEGFYRWFAGIVNNYNFPVERLKFELTEGLIVPENDDFQYKYKRFDRLGVKLVIDDFGTGYSNLLYLRKMPFNSLKVDQGFIADIGSSKSSEEIIKASIAMAKALNLLVVAEGIETEEQHAFLKENGCDYGQGYLLAIPLPIEACLEKIKER